MSVIMSSSRFGKERSFHYSIIGNGSLYKKTIQVQSETDAKDLHSAFVKKDAEKILCILARRTNFQRQEIVRLYDRFYSQELRRRILTSIVNQTFKDILLTLIQETAIYLGAHLQKVLPMKNFSAVTGILTEATAEETVIIANNYEAASGPSLVSDLKKYTCGEYQKGLICLATGAQLPSPVTIKTRRDCKYYYPHPGIEEAEIYANDLHKAFKRKECVCGGNISILMCELDPYGLALVDKVYKKNFGRTLEQEVADKTSGDLKFLLETFLGIANRRTKFFATLIHKLLYASTLDHQEVLRFFITRAEIDLTDIMFAYKKVYKVSLEDDVNKKTSGILKRTLLTLMGRNKNCLFIKPRKK
ncbi:unnamed protein product [Trichobilharzia szidati]|nr:unnamed protein product [Trichobilharzia szidati]